MIRMISPPRKSKKLARQKICAAAQKCQHETDKDYKEYRYSDMLLQYFDGECMLVVQKPRRPIKNHLRQRRRQKGVKQAELAARVGVAQSTISDIENGYIVPGVYLALRIARALASSVEKLFPLPEDMEAEKGREW